MFVPLPGPGRPPVTDADRDRLVDLLGDHFARGDIDAEELERRVEIVLTTRFADEAAGVLADLPALPGAGTSGSGSGRAAPRSGKRHAQTAKPAPGWMPTSERFRDPASGLITRVWLDPADGSRHYVPED